MDAGTILSHLGALIAGALGTYAAFYLRGALARREQIAKSLAAFYASAATAYYARKDYEQPRVLEQPSDRMAFYKLYDQHYQEFLSSSTLLASPVPPTLKVKFSAWKICGTKLVTKDFKPCRARDGLTLWMGSVTKFSIPFGIVG
jgi:hypothetical protein